MILQNCYIVTVMIAVEKDYNFFYAVVVLILDEALLGIKYLRVKKQTESHYNKISEALLL